MVCKKAINSPPGAAGSSEESSRTATRARDRVDFAKYASDVFQTPLINIRRLQAQINPLLLQDKEFGNIVSSHFQEYQTTSATQTLALKLEPPVEGEPAA